MKKENIVTTVAPCENDTRVVVELDKLIAAITYDESVFEQLNIPETS